MTDPVEEELPTEQPEPPEPLKTVIDPETGMSMLCMDEWEAVGFIPSAALVTLHEALESKTYSGPVRPPTEAEILQKRMDDMNEVVEQLLLEQLMNSMMLDLEGL